MIISLKLTSRHQVGIVRIKSDGPTANFEKFGGDLINKFLCSFLSKLEGTNQKVQKT